MKTFFVLCISALCYVFPSQPSTIDQIQLGGSGSQNLLNFSIENQAAITQSLNYIVTQDDLILLRSGSYNLPSGIIENFDVTVTSSGMHTYTLTVTTPEGDSKSFDFTY